MAGIRDTYNLVEKSEVVDLSILKNYECNGKVKSELEKTAHVQKLAISK